jgi:hypothetical protein
MAVSGREVSRESETSRGRLEIDHATLAGPDLDRMRSRFGELGLATEYGGPHSNGVTHMALLGFDDGSYLELISTLEPGSQSPLWNAQIQDGAGPAAWAVRADDLPQEQTRLARAGFTPRGPVPMTRTRPDGTALAWDLLYPRDEPPGATLPFAICDRTPRERRVVPSPSVTGSGVGGIAAVVLGVASIDASAKLFQAAYGLEDRAVAVHPELGARLAQFSCGPVVLAEPLAGSAWLSERIARYGDSPAAVLLACSPTARSRSRLPLLAAEDWFGDGLTWIDPARLFGWRVGLLSRTA